MAVKPTNSAKIKELETLKAERDAAWAAFNPGLPSSRQNDWPSFAQSNAEWLKAYKALYGAWPEDGQTEEDATDWFSYYRYDKGSKPEKRRTDADLDKGNRRKQHAPEWLDQQQQSADSAKKAS